jgi:hypothetical protein
MFCPNCGNDNPDKSRFCWSCGNDLSDIKQYVGSANYSRGDPRLNQNQQQYRMPPNYQLQNNQPQGNNQQNYQQYAHLNQPQYNNYSFNIHEQHRIVQTISSRVKGVATFWIIVAILQAIAAVFNLLTFSFVLGIVFSVISILNFAGASSDYRFANRILSEPNNIVEKYRSVSGLVIALVWNTIILIVAIAAFNGFVIIAGFLAVIVTIYEISSVRGYVLENEMELTHIENCFLGTI